MPYRPEYHPTVRSGFTFADRVKEKPFHLNDDEVNKAILQAVKDYWKHLIESWEVWGREADGCSEEFGVENWVHCDAWSGRSWEYDEAHQKGLLRDKKILMEKGIELLGKVYYLEPEMGILDWETLTLEQVKWSFNPRPSLYAATEEEAWDYIRKYGIPNE